MGSRAETVEALAKLLAHKGIPPFLLAANIAEPSYQSVRLWKDKAAIYVETVCLDDETNQPLTFTYTYSHEQILQRMEMRVGRGHEVLWDRNAEIRKLVNSGRDAEPEATSCTEGWFPRAAHA